jgi:hypothetical protein
LDICDKTRNEEKQTARRKCEKNQIKAAIIIQHSISMQEVWEYLGITPWTPFAPSIENCTETTVLGRIADGSVQNEMQQTQPGTPPGKSD